MNHIAPIALLMRCRTPALSCCRKLKRSVSCRQSAAVLCWAQVLALGSAVTPRSALHPTTSRRTTPPRLGRLPPRRTCTPCPGAGWGCTSPQGPPPSTPSRLALRATCHPDTSPGVTGPSRRSPGHDRLGSSTHVPTAALDEVMPARDTAGAVLCAASSGATCWTVRRVHSTRAGH
jgi:hypothetical protein